jgi:acyl-CoA thioesterase
MAADLLADLALAPDPSVPGRFAASLGPAWSYVSPSGGVLLSLAVRAMREHLASPELPIVSATATFCDPVPEGPIVVDVAILRRGASGAQVRAHLAASGPAAGPYGLEVAATFLRDREGPSGQPARMPDVPPPQRSIPFGLREDGTTLPLRWPFLGNFEIAQAIGEPMWQKGWPRGEAHHGFWYRYKQTPRLPTALVRFLGPEAGPLFAPSLDLTVYFTGPTTSEWLLVETKAARARAGWGVGHAWIWDVDGNLVAQANQAMFLRRPAPPR